MKAAMVACEEGNLDLKAVLTEPVFV